MSETTKPTLADAREYLTNLASEPAFRISHAPAPHLVACLMVLLDEIEMVLLDEIEALKLCVAHPLVTMPALPNDDPSPVERELWEALDRLLVNLGGPVGIYLKSLTIAEAVRDRLRPLMEGKLS